MSNKIDVAAAAQRLLESDSIMILTHRRPDGDTIGSACALCRMLRQKGKGAWLYPNEDLTPRLAFLTQGLVAPQGQGWDLLAAVDIADTSLLTAGAAHLSDQVDLCLDHHPSNKGYARQLVLHEKAAAAGEVIYLLGRAMEVAFDLPIWEALYIAVATDTGCFRFSNTTPLAHRMAADAIEFGLDYLPHNRTFFEAKSKTRFLIERRLFDGLEFNAAGTVCCTRLDRAWLNEIGATDDDLDNLSTLLMSLEEVRCGIVLTQNKKDPAYKVSVRSHRPVDASRICQNFGGGGHPRAAGCTMDMEGARAARLLMAAAEEEIARW